MKIGDVTKLLESIAKGLTGLHKDTASGLISLHAKMQPFAEQTVEQFVEFLSRCDEFKRTGIVQIQMRKSKGTSRPQAAALSVSDAAAKVRATLAEIDNGTVTSSRIESLLDDLKRTFPKPQKPQWEQLLVELKISDKPKTIGHAIELVKHMLNGQLGMHVKGHAFNTPG